MNSIFSTNGGGIRSGGGGGGASGSAYGIIGARNVGGVNGNGSISDDPLYTEEFRVYIEEFCRITNNEVTIKQIASFIEIFHHSPILNILQTEPQNVDALSCLKNYIASNPTLPSIFPSRYIAITNCRIRVAPPRFGSSHADACVATVIPGATRPPTMMINLTADSMREALRIDTERSEVYQCTPATVPSKVKIRFNQSLMNQLVNAQVDLYKTIVEGNRQNGKNVDSYVKSRIK